VTSTETGTCPVMWPVRQAIHAAGWVHEPCGQPTEPGQRYCADCQGWQAQEQRVSAELTARREQRRARHAQRVTALRQQRQRQPYRSLASTVDPFALVGEPEPALPF
jgi:hypothetical protein